MATMTKRASTSFEGLVLAMLAAMATILVPRGQAVDIQGFDSTTGCSGPGYTFSSIAQQICTQFATPEGAVLVRDLSSCQTAFVYVGGGCTTVVTSANGPNVQCFVGAGFTGAQWVNNCRRRRLQENIASSGTPPKCTGHEMVPTGVHFTESASSGSWILDTLNATSVLELLRAIEDAEAKVEWLKAQGAHFIA